MRLGDLDALKEDFKSRLADCNEWIEKAKDKETKIRASAIKAFIGEVIMTIDNAPTVELDGYVLYGTGLELVSIDWLEEQLGKERPQGDLISRSEAEKLGATCLARRNENGQLEAIISLDNAPTVEIVTNEEEAEDYQINQEENCNIVCDLLRDITGVDIRKGEKRLKLAKIWIPVSDRLPEEKINPMTSDFEEVLCTTIWGDVRAYKFGKPIGHDKPHFWLGGGIMDEYVIAWQYKPEPYKEGGAE